MQRVFFVLGLLAATSSCLAADKTESRFLAENAAAMKKMMAGMDVRPSGDIDADFVNMMVPHHQGAIDMAVLQLRYGHNERLRRIAQEIIVGQQEEIGAMRLALGRALPPSAAAPDQAPGPTSQGMPATNMTSLQINQEPRK